MDSEANISLRNSLSEINHWKSTKQRVNAAEKRLPEQSPIITATILSIIKTSSILDLLGSSSWAWIEETRAN